MSWKRIVLAILVVVLLGGTGLFFWARAALTGAAVRTAVAGQLTEALGQKVVIGDLKVRVFPRITLDVADVTIGEPAAITVETLHIGTALGALLSRRIEHADLKLDGARIHLPLPDFATATAAPAAESDAADPDAAPPVELVSIDSIVLNGVELVAGDQTLTGDIELEPRGLNALTIRKVALTAGQTSLQLSGDVTDIAKAQASLTMTAGSIDAQQLMTFVEKFSAATGTTANIAAADTAAPDPAAPLAPMDVTVAMSADRLSFGDLVLETLSGTAHVTNERITIDQATFNVFSGTARGTVVLGLDAASTFAVNATMSDVDMARAVAFAGSPSTVTGRAGGSLDIRGQGVTADEVIASTTGTLTLDAVDGTVTSLGLVKTIVLASSMRASSSSSPQSPATDRSTEEPFSRMGMTLRIANGIARTDNLQFESPDLLLNAAGTLRLDGTNVDLAGVVQLSEALTLQAGRDLVRYTQQDGKVTLPVQVTGPPDALRVRVDLADVTRRAIMNKAREEAQDALKKGLGRIIKK